MDVYGVPVPERFLPLVYRVLADAYEVRASHYEHLSLAENVS